MLTLLNKIIELVEQDRRIQEKRIKNGDTFNVFSILSLQNYEVMTHSAFLSELLSPIGSHGCGDKFLIAFLQTIPIFKEFSFNTKKAIVTKEACIGATNSSMTEGGRIDILIESEKNAIVIENKIYADDEENQMIRYHNYCKRYDNFRLLYLNLEGIEPADYSVGEMILGEDYHIISYSEDILSWLQKCKMLSKDRTLVKSSIIQYSDLIKKLTNKMNDNTEKELMSLLCSKDNMEKTAIILDKYDKLKKFFFEDQFVKKIKAWAKRKDMETTDEFDKFSFAIRPKGWKNHWIVLESPKVRHDIQIYRSSGKVHKQLQLDCLNSGNTNKDWPFGYLWCTDILNSNEKIVNGEAYEEIKAVIMCILKELNEKSQIIIDMNIVL